MSKQITLKAISKHFAIPYEKLIAKIQARLRFTRLKTRLTPEEAEELLYHVRVHRSRINPFLIEKTNGEYTPRFTNRGDTSEEITIRSVAETFKLDLKNALVIGNSISPFIQEPDDWLPADFAEFVLTYNFQLPHEEVVAFIKKRTKGKYPAEPKAQSLMPPPECPPWISLDLDPCYFPARAYTGSGRELQQSPDFPGAYLHWPWNYLDDDIFNTEESVEAAKGELQEKYSRKANEHAQQPFDQRAKEIFEHLRAIQYEEASAEVEMIKHKLSTIIPELDWRLRTFGYGKFIRVPGLYVAYADKIKEWSLAIDRCGEQASLASQYLDEAPTAHEFQKIAEMWIQYPHLTQEQLRKVNSYLFPLTVWFYFLRDEHFDDALAEKFQQDLQERFSTLFRIWKKGNPNAGKLIVRILLNFIKVLNREPDSENFGKLAGDFAAWPVIASPHPKFGQKNLETILQQVGTNLVFSFGKGSKWNPEDKATKEAMRLVAYLQWERHDMLELAAARGLDPKDIEPELSRRIALLPEDPSSSAESEAEAKAWADVAMEVFRSRDMTIFRRIMETDDSKKRSDSEIRRDIKDKVISLLGANKAK